MTEQSRNPFPELDVSGSETKRQGIDRGLEGDKVNYPDPAAAPFGTDAEAAGETSPFKPAHSASGGAAHPDSTPRPNDPNPPQRGPMQVFLIAIAAIAAIIVIAALIAW